MIEVHRTLMKFARKWTRCDEDAEDVAGWAYLKYLEKGEKAQNSSYLWKLMKGGYALLKRKQLNYGVKSIAQDKILFDNEKVEFHEALNLMFPMLNPEKSDKNLTNKVHKFYSPELQTTLHFTASEIKEFKGLKMSRDMAILDRVIPFFLYDGKVYPSCKHAGKANDINEHRMAKLAKKMTMSKV